MSKINHCVYGSRNCVMTSSEVCAIRTQHLFPRWPPSTVNTITHYTGGITIWLFCGNYQKRLVPTSRTDYCLKSVEGQLKTVFCVDAAALETQLELRKCNRKTGYNRQSCRCNKNHLVCTDLFRAFNYTVLMAYRRDMREICCEIDIEQEILML